MIRARFLLLLALLSTTLYVYAQRHPWTPTLTMPKATWLPGEPIVATLVLTNDSGTAQPFEWHGQFYLDGAAVPCSDKKAPVASRPTPDEQRGAATARLQPALEPPGACHRIQFALARECNLAAKDAAIIGSHRLCYRDVAESGLSEGPCVAFSIESPAGIDAAAMGLFPSGLRGLDDSPEVALKILRQYPTSTYSADIVYGMLRGFGEGDQESFMQSISSALYLSNSYPDDTGKSKDGWKWLKGKEAADWWSKWIGIILNNHPDIWFADELRLKLAVDQVALKNYQGGAADLEVLSKQAKPDVAQKAQCVLDAMKQRGWIKG